MIVTTDLGSTTPAISPPYLRRLQTVAVVRIAFGLVWAIDAIFKWLPGCAWPDVGQGARLGFEDRHSCRAPMDSALVRGRHGQSGLFAVGVGVVESVIAICLVLGAFSRPVLLGAAVFSFGIWSAAEGFHLPWSKPGITDLGPSVGYVVASLARYLAAAGATWSVDNRLRPRMGKPAWLCSPRRTNLARSS